MNSQTALTYKSLYKAAFISTILMLIIIPTQILVFVLTKLPETTIEWFTLFKQSVLIGFFHADFFILINNILIVIIYLAFYHALKDINKGVIQIGIVLGLIGISAYISSNKTFELLRLSQEYFAHKLIPTHSFLKLQEKHRSSAGRERHSTPIMFLTESLYSVYRC